MLHDKVVIKVLNYMDRYQNKIYTEYPVNNVHLQSTSDVLKRANDTEVQLKGILFIDDRKSTPRLDFYELQRQSLEKGDTMRAVVYDASGKMVDDFAVVQVDGEPDVPATRLHHWELSLI
jgi:hypothetical protein